MLAISVTGIRETKLICINGRLNVSRLYLSSNDLPSFPNRLVFNVACRDVADLVAELGELVEPWVAEEVGLLNRGSVFIIVPIALRVQEEGYTSFFERVNSDRTNAVNLTLPEYTVFIRGVELPSLCIGCERQSTLKGRPCPDYVEGNFSCFRSTRFMLDAMDTFYLSEKGEMIYNAASISEPTDEQVASDTVTSSTDANPA